MESQLTLIGVPAPAPQDDAIIFVFDRDDMSNTTVRISGESAPSYTVYTYRGNTTMVYARDHLLATISRRLFRRDRIIFPGLKPMRLGRWLKAPLIWSFPLVFKASGRKFEWRENMIGDLVLRESKGCGDIIAQLSRSRRSHDNTLIRAASLRIKPEISELVDVVVLSCMLAEYKLRIVSEVQATMCVPLII